MTKSEFYKKLDYAVESGKITIKQAVELAEQHKMEVEGWKQAKKFARPVNGFSRITKCFQWN